MKPGDLATDEQCQMVLEASIWRSRALKAEAALSTRPPEPTPATLSEGDARVEQVARAIATELARQEGEEWSLSDTLTIEYLDQGEVDFALVARAAIAALEPKSEPVEEM